MPEIIRQARLDSTETGALEAAIDGNSLEELLRAVRTGLKNGQATLTQAAKSGTLTRPEAAKALEELEARLAVFQALPKSDEAAKFVAAHLTAIEVVEDVQTALTD